MPLDDAEGPQEAPGGKGRGGGAGVDKFVAGNSSVFDPTKSSRVLTYAGVCWRMLTYADICWLTYAGVEKFFAGNSSVFDPTKSSRVLTYADKC